MLLQAFAKQTGNELLAQETGIKLLHVPYKGTSGALTDLMGGHVEASIVALQTAACKQANVPTVCAYCVISSCLCWGGPEVHQCPHPACSWQ